MKPLTDQERQFAEAAARVIEVAANSGLTDTPDKLGVRPMALHLIARAYVELRGKVRALYDLVDTTDPNDPIDGALTKAGFRPADADPQPRTEPRVVRSTAEVQALSNDDLLAIYCRVMRVPASFFLDETYVVRGWDGMDGCWTDCTGKVGQEEALRYWAERTGGGAHHVTYDEIDYYRIFPGDTHMLWDGADGQEMHR